MTTVAQRQDIQYIPKENTRYKLELSGILDTSFIVLFS